MIKRPAPLDGNLWWQQRSKRERTVLVAGIAFVAVAFIYAGILAPMLDVVAAAPQLRAARTAREAVAAAQVDVIRANGAAAPARTDARAAVERALREHGLSGAGSTLDVQDGRVLVTLPTVALGELSATLAQLEQSDGLRVVAATLTPRVDSGVRAELTLAR